MKQGDYIKFKADYRPMFKKNDVVQILGFDVSGKYMALECYSKELKEELSEDGIDVMDNEKLVIMMEVALFARGEVELIPVRDVDIRNIFT